MRKKESGKKLPQNKKSIDGQKVLRAKRSLGQNFLISKAVAQSIANAGELTNNDTVLEVGPGKGILTRELLVQAGTVIAFEKDDELYAKLKEIFEKEIDSKKLILIHDDIFNFENHRDSFGESLKTLKIVANIPYNITGKLLPFFFGLAPMPSKIVLLVQKEVADRIVARDGKESILSISVKAVGTPRSLKKVSKKLFSPSPKVDSAVLLISDISKKNFEKVDEQTFFKLVKQGFSEKRKMLKNNLDTDRDKLFACGIKESARAEELTVNDWLCLTKHEL
ncbi:ribosomal RNA small subunit methyltransferase A [bacterium]|nr:ribosomal RNA small subunit methyltransferase A [bacterium]|tara:strand:- start:5433 stop:6272 length:840 start_codon:yes stop_codon:yes gene_type:complete